MAVLSREEFYQQYDAAKQQGMDSNQAINYLAQAAVAAQPYNKQTSSSYSPQKVDTWQPGDRVPSRSEFNAARGITDTWQPPKTQQPVYNANAALKNLQKIASTTTDKQLAKMITKYTSGDAKKDNFWGQTAASFGSGKINELLNQAWGKYAQDGSAESKAVADAYAQLAEYYQNVNAEALDDKNRKAKWISQDMAQYLPQFMEQTKASAAPILGGAAAGAVIGEMVTPIPGADALIGALAGGVKGAMGGTVAGTKVGGLIGAGKYSYNTMRGAAMKNLLEAGATTEQAQEASRDEAIISTAIENLDNAADLFLLIPGMGGMGKAAAKTALGKFAEWAGNVAQEGGEEFIQELISIANERRVKNGTTGDGAIGLAKEVMALGQEIAKDAKNSDDLKQALEAARGGAVIGGFMGPTGAAVNKVITGPMQNAALNAINDAAPNQTVAQQNRNYIAESNADSRAREEVSDYIRSTNSLSNEESNVRTKAYSEYAMQLDQAKRDDILVDGDGKLVGQVRGIAGNGFTLQTKGGSEAVFRSEASGSLDKNGAIYKALQSGGEFISEKEYAERQAQAKEKVAEAAETAPATHEMPEPEMATQEQLVQEAPAEMPSETPVSALENEGTSIADEAPESSTMQSDELVGQANEEAEDGPDEDANYDEDVAFIDRAGKPIYWDMQDQNHDALLGDGNWDDRKGLNAAIRNGNIRIKSGNGIELSFENGRLSSAQRDAIERLIRDFRGKTFYVDGDIDAGGRMATYYSRGFEGSDIDAKTIINWINKSIQEHEAEIGNNSKEKSKSGIKYQRMLTLRENEIPDVNRTFRESRNIAEGFTTIVDGDPKSVDDLDNAKYNYTLGGERFSPEDVERMTVEDVLWRLKSWANELGYGKLRGFLNNYTEDMKLDKPIDGKQMFSERNAVGESGQEAALAYLREQDFNEPLTDAIARFADANPDKAKDVTQYLFSRLLKDIDSRNATVEDAVNYLEEATAPKEEATAKGRVDEESAAEIAALVARAPNIYVRLSNSNRENLMDILRGGKDQGIEYSTPNDFNYLNSKDEDLLRQEPKSDQRSRGENAEADTGEYESVLAEEDKAKAIAEKEAEKDRRAIEKGKSPYGATVSRNGKSFVTKTEAQMLPAGNLKFVRGIKVGDETYYALSSEANGGYKNIMPDADVEAAKNLIEQIKEYIDQHNRSASYYAELEREGKPIPSNFENTYRTVLHLKEVLDKIQNDRYTVSDFWRDRSIPKEFNMAAQISEEFKGRSIQAIADAVAESDARSQIERMIGGQNEQGIQTQNDTRGTNAPRLTEPVRLSGREQNESTSVSEGWDGNVDNLGQLADASEGRKARRLEAISKKSLGRTVRDKAESILKRTKSAAATLREMHNEGYVTRLNKNGKSGIAVSNPRPVDASFVKTMKGMDRLLNKVSDGDIQAYLVDSVTGITDTEASATGGVVLYIDGKQTIFATTEQSFLHESNHQDFENASEYAEINGVTDDFEDWMEKRLRAVCKDAEVNYDSLASILGAHYKKGIAEEMYCELASLAADEDAVSMFDGLTVKEMYFTDAADKLRGNEMFERLINEVQEYADKQADINWRDDAEAEGKHFGREIAFQRDISFTDDKEADIEDVMRMIEEDRKKPSLADYKASRDTMDAESRAETTREIEESFDEHRETTPEARKATQAERFGVKGDDNPLNLAKKVAEQSAKLKEKSVLNNDRKRAKMFGENKAAQRAKARFNGYMDVLSKAANAEADIAELFTYANTLKDDPEMGVYVNEKVLNNLRKAAQLEEESAQTPTPDVVNAFKYQATKAMAMAAQQAENVDRVQSTIQSGLIEAALKYSKGNTDNVLVKGAQWLNRMQLNPGNFFRMIGGYDKESRNTGYAMQQRVDRQNAVRITTEARLKDFFSGIKNDKQYRDFASGKTKSDVVMGDHKLSMLQAVQFKMLCDTLGIDDIRTSRLETLNGFALRDAGGNDTFVEMEGNTQAERYAWASQLYDQAVKSINENSAAKAYMEAAAKMFEDVKPDLVSVGEKVDGFPKAMYAEGKYLPLSYASKDGHPMDWTLTNDMASGLSTTRIMQERVRENGGYAVIRPVSQTVDSYISQAANYIAYAELGNDLSIMGDANSLYGSLQNTIAKNFGDTYAQWLTNYTNDVNQIKSVDPTGLNKVLAKARTMMQQGALLGSLSVPIKQISSYFSAMGVVDPRAVMKAYSPIRRSGNNIIDYLYKSRLQGSIDPDVSQALNSGWVEKLKKSGKLGAAVVNATNIMDSRTVANVYQACCYDVEMNSGLTKAELYKNGKDLTDGLTNAGELLVHSLFSEAVLNTQPIFNRQARAEIARTSSEALRMLSVFRTQQTQNYNRLLTTINEAKAAKKFGGDTKSANREMRQTIGGQVAAAASISALTILADMLLHKHKKYKDEDDEFDEKKILDRFALNFVEAGAGTALFAGDATKWLIDQIKGNTGDYASNKEFYGISMGAISSLKSAMNAWSWLYSDMLKGGKHAASDLRYAVNYTATLLGIPTQNAYNLMNSFYQYTGDILGKDIISGYGSEKYEDMMKELDAIRNDFGNKLYSAIRAGNTAKAKESVEQMGDKFLSMIKTSSMEQLKSGDADDDEVLNVLMTYGNRTAEEAADDVMKMHLQIDTGYTSLTGTGKQTAETAYKDGKIDRSEFKKLYTKYSGKTSEQAEYSINRIDFKQKYPGNTYQDIKKMYMDGKLSKAEAAEWRYKTQENATKESAENWVKNLDFQKMTGYEANYTSTSDLYDTYESKEKLGVISFYDKYGSQFSSPKAFGDVFNYLNNNERTDFPTYKTSYGETSKNQSRVITLMNELIQQKKITYDMAKKIWSEHYGWSTSGKSAWVNVKAA